MKKKILVLTLILGLSGFSAAQVVEIDGHDSFPEELNAGESFELEIDYSVNSVGEVPLSLELNVSRGSELVEPFYVNASGNQCKPVEHVFRCDLNDVDEDGSVELSVGTDYRLRPGEYGFELDLLSSVGFGSHTYRENISAGETVEVAGDEVWASIEASEESWVEFTELNFIGANPPTEDSVFIGGIKANIRDENGADIGDQASGTVRVNFDEGDIEGLERDSLQLYFYNMSSNNWKSVRSEIAEDYVEAEAEHFSVYAAFGRETSSSTVVVDSNGSVENVTEPDPEEPGEEPGSGEEPGGETETRENPEDEQGSEEPEDPNSEQPGEEPEEEPGASENENRSITGQFTEAASSPLTVFAVVIALVTGYLIYSRRHRRIAEKIQGSR